MLLGSLYFLVISAKILCILAQREPLLLCTQADDFSITPGGTAQASRVLDEARHLGCDQHSHF